MNVFWCVSIYDSVSFTTASPSCFNWQRPRTLLYTPGTHTCLAPLLGFINKQDLWATAFSSLALPSCTSRLQFQLRACTLFLSLASTVPANLLTLYYPLLLLSSTQRSHSLHCHASCIYHFYNFHDGIFLDAARHFMH